VKGYWRIFAAIFAIAGLAIASAQPAQATQIDGTWWGSHAVLAGAVDVQNKYQVGHDVATVFPGLSCRADGFSVVLSAGHGTIIRVRMTESYMSGSVRLDRNAADFYPGPGLTTWVNYNLNTPTTYFNWMNANAGNFPAYMAKIQVFTTTDTQGLTPPLVQMCG